jgi:sigma-B regulation protein RsbU (phosphoserine phosphatase)
MHSPEIQRLETFLSVAKKLTSELDLDRLLDTIMDEVTSVMDAERSSLYLIDEENNEIWTKVMQGLSDIIRIPIGTGISGLVADTGEIIRIKDAWEFPGYDRSWDIQNNFRTRSVLCMPISNKADKRIGVIQVINKRDGVFSEEDQDILTGLTSLIAIAIENAMLHKDALEKQRMESELELAASIQRQLLPEKPPPLEGYEIAAMSVPARHVGGDYYDFIEETEDHIDLIIGDISGKGIPAAMLMATAIAGLHAIHEPSIPERLAKLNDLIHDSTDAWQYSTLFYASLHLKDKRITTVNAGHNEIILIRENGEIELLCEGGMPVGMFDSGTNQYDSETTQLNSGDMIVMFTDGVTDATSPEDESFGEERLMEIVKQNRDRSAGEVKDRIYGQVTEFVSDAPQFDDLTVLVLKVL